MHTKIKELINWTEAQKLKLEQSGRTNSDQYTALLGWVADAAKFAELPGDFTFPCVDTEGLDPRTWASRVMDLDPSLRRFIRLNGEMPS